MACFFFPFISRGDRQVSRVLDKDPKLWRLVGDSLMVLSVFIELCSPFRPPLFLLFGSASALCREVADACSGPSYRVFLQSLAIDENIGDVSSRSEIHVVLGTLLGLAMGAGTAQALAAGSLDWLGLHRPALTFAAAAAFSAAHLACTWRETRTIRLRTLNQKRLQLVLARFVESGGEAVMTTADAARLEPVFARGRRDTLFGAQLLDFVECGSDVRRAMGRRADGCIVALADGGRVGVMLGERVGDESVLKAALTAAKIQAILEGLDDEARERLRQGDEEDVRARDRAAAVVEQGYAWVEGCFGTLCEGLRVQGWSTRLLIDKGGTRFREAGLGGVPEKLTQMRREVESASRDE